MNTREVYPGALVRLPVFRAEASDFYIVQIKDGIVSLGTTPRRARWWLPFRQVVETGTLVKRSPDDTRARSRPFEKRRETR
jgi:hypothetical protein